MNQKTLIPVDDSNSISENRVIQKTITNQTSVSVYEETSTQESSTSSEITKTTAQTKGETNEEYDSTKPRRIIIRARIDNGEGS